MKDKGKTKSSVTRPYLSEAWEFQSDKWIERAEKDSMGLDLRMAMLCGEMNMKDSLKREAREEENNLSEGERKPTPEKPEPRLETRNNLPNLQSIFGGEHYPNLE
ncbi:hypothetical protein YC2023_083251 [Brassica napus]